MRFLLDSSVISKLFIEEKGSKEAIEILSISHTKDIELFASELVLYEVGNTIWKHLRNKKKGGSEYIMRLFLLNIEYRPLGSDLACDVMTISQKYDITYYDGVHVALSKECDAKLITEDKELLHKIKGSVNLKTAINMVRKLGNGG